MAHGDAAILSLATGVSAACQRLDVLQVVSDAAPLVSEAVVAEQWSRPLREAADGMAASAEAHQSLVTLYNSLNTLDQLVSLDQSAGKNSSQNFRNPFVA